MCSYDHQQFIEVGIQQFPDFLTRNQEHCALLFLSQKHPQTPSSSDVPFVREIFSKILENYG
jgi:hypothetical protein